MKDIAEWGTAQPSLLSLWSSASPEHCVQDCECEGQDGHQRRVGWLRGCNPVQLGQLCVRCGKQHCSYSGVPSGDIVILVGNLLVTLHVVSVYERLNPLLQVSRLCKKRKNNEICV